MTSTSEQNFFIDGAYDAITASSDGSASVIENNNLTMSLDELTLHINNPDNATLSLSNMTVTNGSVVDNGDDTYTFIPVTDFNGDMTINYDVNDGTTTINTSTDITVLNEVVGTLLDDNLDGGFDADAIYGLASDDLLQGSTGNDTIVGGSGNDTLTGGAGEDSFVFELGDQGTSDTPAQDTITDFEVGVDHLDISDFLSAFSSDTGVELSELVDLREEGGNTIISLKSDGTNVDQEIIVENTTLNEFYGGDSSGATEGDILQKMIDDNNLINTSG
jgi:Ca2+-binding RTX toxin-like protein